MVETAGDFAVLEGKRGGVGGGEEGDGGDRDGC